jgi:transcriptional regulator with XRE-family HTH domain
MKTKIKELCRVKGITLSEIALKIRTSQTSLSRALGKNGNPTFDTLQKIAAALGVEVWELFTSDTSKNELTALISHRGDYYKANTLSGLKEAVNDIEGKMEEDA